MLCSVLRAFKVFFVGNAFFSSNAILHLDSNHSPVAISYHLEHDALHFDHSVTLIQNDKYQKCFQGHPHTVTQQYLYLSSELKHKLKIIDQVTAFHKGKKKCPSCPKMIPCKSCSPCPTIHSPLEQKSVLTEEHDNHVKHDIHIVSHTTNHPNHHSLNNITTTSQSDTSSSSQIKKNNTVISNQTSYPNSVRTVLPSLRPTPFKVTHNISNTSTSHVISLASDKKNDNHTESGRPVSKSIRPIYIIQEQTFQYNSGNQKNINSKQYITDTGHLLNDRDAHISNSDRIYSIARSEKNVKQAHLYHESESESEDGFESEP